MRGCCCHPMMCDGRWVGGTWHGLAADGHVDGLAALEVVRQLAAHRQKRARTLQHQPDLSRQRGGGSSREGREERGIV